MTAQTTCHCGKAGCINCKPDLSIPHKNSAEETAAFELGFQAGRKAERKFCNDVVRNFYKTFIQPPPDVDTAEMALKVEQSHGG